jgi:hypothetical protein
MKFMEPEWRTLSTLLDEAPHATGTAIGGYRLLRELGRGGMGAVWLAERMDGIVTRAVALKLPHSGLVGPQLAERWQRERDILASLVHPHIAKLYDAGIDESGQPYLALEYVEGAEITAFCDRRCLAVSARLELFLQVLDAVQYAHSRLVVHRDIKPSNILVTDSGQVILLDFGIAKFLGDGTVEESELTRLTGRALTPDFASPEQIVGGAIATTSDIYSLGVVLFELLTGARPYRIKRHSTAALEDAILAVEPLRPAACVPDPQMARARASTPNKLARELRGDLGTIVLKALKKRALDRYATGEAFAQDLRHYLRGEPVRAQADSKVYRMRKFLGRNRFAAASAVSIFLALGVGLGAAHWQAGVAREQARLARDRMRTSEVIQTFMEDLFKANVARKANPTEARQTSARELLDIGAQEINHGLNDAPAAKFRVLGTLMQMYDDLDLPKTATELGDQRVALARSLYGEGSRELADALIDLGSNENTAGMVDAAGKALDEALAILSGANDSSSYARGRLETQLAFNSLLRDAPARAIDHDDQGIRILRTLPPSRDLLWGLVIKASLNYHAGDLKRAKLGSLEAMEVAGTLKNQANSLLPFANGTLGLTLAALEELPAAEIRLRAALAAAHRYAGDDTMDTLEALQALGKFLILTSRVGEGLRVLTPARSLADRIAATGESSVVPARALETVARGLNASGRIEEGLETIKVAMAMRHGRDPAAWFDTPLAMQMAASLTEVGRYGAATGILDEISRKHGQGADLHTRPSNDFVLARTRLLLAQGHAEDAQNAFAAYQAEVLPSGTVSRSVLEQRVTSAEIALARGDAEKALEIAGEVRTLVTGSANRPYLGNWEARAALAEGTALCRQGHAGDALALLGRANQLGTSLFDRRRSLFLGSVKIALGDCLLDLGRPGQARMAANEALSVQATHPELGEHYRRPMRDLQARIDSAANAPEGPRTERPSGSR